MNIGNKNPFRYRGYYFDKEFNLYYLKTRYYDSRLGRFISPDSISYTNPESVMGYNLYAYCNDNPVMYVDIDGHSATLIILGLIGATLGFGIAAYIDSQDGEMFNGDVKWYDYLGASVLGTLVGLGAGWLGGLSSSFTIPTFGIANLGGVAASGITGGIELTISGAQILAGIGASSLILMMASHNRPRNNVDQNKQFKDAVRKVGLNPNDPKVKDELRKIHQYIRKTRQDLGWQELVELIRKGFGW